METEKKNNALGTYRETKVDDGFYVLRLQNDSKEPMQYEREASSAFIQFHFCVKGSAELTFNNGNYQLPLVEDHSILLYNHNVICQ